MIFGSLETMLLGLILKWGGKAAKKLAAKSDNEIDDHIANFVEKAGTVISDPTKALELTKVVENGKKVVEEGKELLKE